MTTRYIDLFRTESKNYLSYDPNNTTTTNQTYPHSPNYRYESYIEFIDFDKECESDISSGNGFIVEPSKRSIKKDLKAENGIYSPKFGQTLADTNPFIDRYKCDCKYGDGLRGRLNVGLKCPKCGKVCRYVDDDVSYFGWIKLIDPYQIIHPAFYRKIESFFGSGIAIKGQKRSKLENILDVKNARDLAQTTSVKNEPFIGIGMIQFREKFDEIMNYYFNLKKSNNGKLYYDDIYSNIEKIFTHSIPVFSTILRPIDIDSTNTMSYETSNGIYAMMNRLATSINKVSTKMEKNKDIKDQQLYNLQQNFMKLYGQMGELLSGKTGDFRCLLGGRCNFTSRNVIVQNPNLRIDEVTLPLVGLTILLEQRIKNILCRIYNMNPTDAHAIWYQACIEPNDKISMIIQSIIDDCKSKGMAGLPVIINRNPTISYGSILQMFCVGFTNTYTMGIPLQVLEGLAADFDGDVLNILLPMNQRFIQLMWEKFNPRNAMYISRNDGSFNTSVCMKRDTLINANTLARCGRESYTQDEINHLEYLFNLKHQMMKG